MAFPDNPRGLKVLFGFSDSAATDPPAVTYTQVSPDPDDDTDPGPVLGSVTVARGRLGDQGVTDTTRITTSLRNDDGRFSRRNVSGPHYGLLRPGTPVQVTVDPGGGDFEVACAAQPSWEPIWDGPGINERVPIDALGILARLGRDSQLLSALRRTISATTQSHEALEYWPMEDGPLASRFFSAIPDRSAMFVTGEVDLAAVDDMPGSGPLCMFTASTQLEAPVSAAVFGASWAFAWKAKFETIPASAVTLIEVTTSGGDGTRWVLTLSSTNLTITAYSSAGAVVHTASVSSTAVVAGQWLTVRIGVDVDISDIFYGGIALLGADLATASVGTVAAAGSPTGILVPHSSDLTDMSMGHLFAVSDAGVSNFPEAELAYEGELADDRFERVATEEGLAVAASAGLGEPLGPQAITTTLAIFREAEASDHGVLYELRNGRLAYQPLADRYNAAVVMTLTYGTEAEPGDVSDLLMHDDDRDVANIVTVTRSGGSSTIVEKTDGPVGSDVTTGIGPRHLAVTLSLEADGQTGPQAGWLLGCGTIDQPRWTVLLDPRHVAALVPDVLNLDIGSRIQITGAPPDQAGPDTLDLIVEGMVETYGADVWTVLLWCEPYAPYLTRVLAEDDPDDDNDLVGWLDADTLEVESGADDTETSWSVTSDPLSSTDADDFPVNCEVAGELITVTAVSGASSPQTFTVTRSVNGVVKSHDAGTPIVLDQPILLTLT